MKCNKNSWASCCRLVENSGWPRPTRALNICGAIPIWSPWKQSRSRRIFQWWELKLAGLYSHSFLGENPSIRYSYLLRPRLVNPLWLSSHPGFRCAVFLSWVWCWFGIVPWQQTVTELGSVINKQSWHCCTSKGSQSLTQEEDLDIGLDIFLYFKQHCEKSHHEDQIYHLYWE